MISESIGMRIRKIRDEYGLNQKEFAQRIGVTNAHISRLEKGVTIPSEALTKLICKEFDINIIWLKTGQEPMFVSSFNIDEKMEKSVANLNMLLKSDDPSIRNNAADLNLLFSKIINVETMNKESKEKYLNLMVDYFSSFQEYTDFIKQDLSNPIYFDIKTQSIVDCTNNINTQLRQIKRLCAYAEKLCHIFLKKDQI